jgi:hypothetical protein
VSRGSGGQGELGGRFRGGCKASHRIVVGIDAPNLGTVGGDLDRAALEQPGAAQIGSGKGVEGNDAERDEKDPAEM